jgi:hypothetical protein
MFVSDESYMCPLRACKPMPAYNVVAMKQAKEVA